jgi:hypothetical protein
MRICDYTVGAYQAKKPDEKEIGFSSLLWLVCLSIWENPFRTLAYLLRCGNSSQQHRPSSQRPPKQHRFINQLPCLPDLVCHTNNSTKRSHSQSNSTSDPSSSIISESSASSLSAERSNPTRNTRSGVIRLVTRAFYTNCLVVGQAVCQAHSQAQSESARTKHTQRLPAPPLRQYQKLGLRRNAEQEQPAHEYDASLWRSTHCKRSGRCYSAERTERTRKAMQNK